MKEHICQLPSGGKGAWDIACGPSLRHAQQLAPPIVARVLLSTKHCNTTTGITYSCCYFSLFCRTACLSHRIDDRPRRGAQPPSLPQRHVYCFPTKSLNTTTGINNSCCYFSASPTALGEEPSPPYCHSGTCIVFEQRVSTRPPELFYSCWHLFVLHALGDEPVLTLRLFSHKDS